MYQKLLLFRRFILQFLVPDIFWPEEISIDGVSVPLRKMKYSFGTKWILTKGQYEAEERKLLVPILKQGMQVLEMGSSIGIVTAIIADKIGSTGKMVAIEAADSLVSNSAEWLSRYPHLHLVNGFAFPVAEVPALDIAGFDEVRGNLGGVVVFGQGTVPAKYNNRVWDINRVCRDYNLQPELLVVDIEGSEVVLATQPMQCPASVRFILMEFHPGLYPNGKNDENAIRSSILSAGFREINRSNGVSLFER